MYSPGAISSSLLDKLSGLCYIIKTCREAAAEEPEVFVMKKWVKCFGPVLPAVLIMLVTAGCAVENNYRECDDFFDFLVRNNVAVTKSQALNPAPFRATSGMAFEVVGMEDGKEVPVDVAVYKFNQDLELMRKRLKEIRKSGCVYLLGIKLPTQINGSFILLGYERSKQKKQILKAFQEFK